MRFTHFNLLRQREEPCIYPLHDEMNGFLMKLCGKVLSLEEMRIVSQLQLLNISNQVADGKLFVGFLTRQRLRQLSSLKEKHFIVQCENFMKHVFTMQ